MFSRISGFNVLSIFTLFGSKGSHATHYSKIGYIAQERLLSSETLTPDSLPLPRTRAYDELIERMSKSPKIGVVSEHELRQIKIQKDIDQLVQDAYACPNPDMQHLVLRVADILSHLNARRSHPMLNGRITLE